MDNNMILIRIKLKLIRKITWIQILKNKVYY